MLRGNDRPPALVAGELRILLCVVLTELRRARDDGKGHNSGGAGHPGRNASTRRGVCCGFARRRGPTVFKTFVPRFPPFGDCRGGVDGFDPLEKRVCGPFEGSAVGVWLAHLGSRSGEQPREYAAGRVGSSARQRRNAPVRADGRTATRLARGAASPMGRRGLRLGPRGREECGRGSRRGGARGTPEARAVIASSESASAETPRGKPRPASAQISPTASSRAPSHPGPRFGTLAGQSPRTCVTRLPSWAPPRAPRRPPRGPRVRSPSDLLADAERPPAVRTP